MAIEWKQCDEDWYASIGDLLGILIIQSLGSFVVSIAGRNEIQRHPLAATDIDAAKAEAMGIARRMLTDALAALEQP